MNTESYCHDCGTKINGENFYCDNCLNKNGLNKINIAVVILSAVSPLLAIFLFANYKKELNPGIHKSCQYGIYAFVVILVLSFVFGFLSAFIK